MPASYELLYPPGFQESAVALTTQRQENNRKNMKHKCFIHCFLVLNTSKLIDVFNTSLSFKYILLLYFVFASSWWLLIYKLCYLTYVTMPLCFLLTEIL